MDGITCDRCGKPLLVDDDVRYVVNMEIFAAYDPLELTQEDLDADRSAEIARLIRTLEKLDPEDAQDQVYRCLRFDVCPACQKALLRNPLCKPEARPLPPSADADSA